MNNTGSNKIISPNEIDLVEVIHHIWSGRWLIAKITLVFLVLGFVIAFTTTEQFNAEARLLPEVSDSKGGASALLRQFGGLGGLNLPLGDEGDAIRPELYPDVLKSTPFFMSLMEYKIKVIINNADKEILVYNYISEQLHTSFWQRVSKYTIKLPWTIMEWLKYDSNESEPINYKIGHIQSITKNQYAVINKLKDCIGAKIDQRSGVISINAKFSDPEIAAQIAQYTVDYLKEYITDYRTKKSEKNLLFVKQRYEEKKQEFYVAQNALSYFRDTNRNIISATAQAEEQRLQDQYNLTFNVFNGLAQQLEQARIKVQEETPVIEVLEPVNVPVERSSPRRGLILLLSALMGIATGVVIVLTLCFAQKFNIKYNKLI